MAMRQILCEEVGLFVPSGRKPFRFAGPIENHVELARHRAGVALYH